jgi:hypothetical protein
MLVCPDEAILQIIFQGNDNLFIISGQIRVFNVRNQYQEYFMNNCRDFDVRNENKRGQLSD